MKYEFKLKEIDLERIKKEPSFDGNLDDEDAFSSFNDYSGSTYICDAIAEIADSQTNIYNSDLWDKARYNEEYIAEAISQGLVDTGRNFDLMKLFQAGEYEYYTACLYGNLKELCFNYALNHIMEQTIEFEAEVDIDLWETILDRLIELIEEKLEDISDNNNQRYDDLDEQADNFLQEAIDELIEEYEEEYTGLTCTIQ